MDAVTCDPGWIFKNEETLWGCFIIIIFLDTYLCIQPQGYS